MGISIATQSMLVDCLRLDGGQGGSWRVMAKRYKDSFWEDENVQ